MYVCDICKIWVRTLGHKIFSLVRILQYGMSFSVVGGFRICSIVWKYVFQYDWFSKKRVYFASSAENYILCPQIGIENSHRMPKSRKFWKK